LNVYAKKQTGDGTFKVEVPYFYDFTAYATTFGGINLNCDEAIQYNEDLKRIVKMDLKTVTNIDDPIPVYTIEEFYKMQENADIDYILMNDLHFGVPETLAGNLPSGWEPGTYTTAPYTPFALGVKSFDGNTHVIDIYGNINIPNNETNVGLFTTINQGTILVNLFVNYLPVNEVTPLGRQYAINLSINNTNNVVGDESVNVSTISFGGLAGVNNGVISNCIVNYLGNLNIQLKNGESEVNIAGFVSQNSGKITYSTVMGPNWNDKHENFNIYMETSNPGSMATFVNRNSDLISNCQAEFVGINNTAHASLNAKVGGFVTSNSGRIINSSVAGQRLTGKDDTLVEDTLKPVCKNDDRIKEIDKASYDSENKYFARLYSQANIGGFVYSNSGSIKDSYSYIPMETQARTAGFVYDNSNAGKISTSYNYSIYDGAIGDNFANSPFVGTNEKGEVLNNSEVCEVNYCYYIIPADRKYKDEVINAEPASGIAAGADETEEGKGSVVMDINNFVGFDFGESDGLGIWTNAMPNEYNPSVLLINSNIQNYKLLIDKEFERKPIEDVKTTTKDETGKDVEVFTLKFPRAGSSKVPYTIANELQFVNTFTIYSKDGVMKRDIRMINDIDFADYAGTEVFNNIKNTIYAGRDFDGNGMKISNIKLTGATNSQNQSAYSNVSNSYGLFYQIGTASVVENDERIGINFDPEKENKTVIRNLTLGVKEISSSTSAFTGILAGVVVNSSIKSLTINASGVNVSGRNAVGGLAGAVIGHSTLHDISVNANVSSTFLNYANNTYPDKSLDEVNKYSYINYDEIEQSSTPLTEFDLSNYIANCSYAGGVAGIIDINNPLELKEEEQQTEES
ncbi:MAG TPA: hypothetical protein DCO89_02985, partial [Clostridiales bacterium]|nr:hypothetical protein [Clostridiales bacterium]